jgi:hypothetical protein
MAATLAGFRAYALERGNSAPTSATDADAEAALVRATDYIADHYQARFLAEHIETVPDAVDAATYEAAAIELATPDFFSQTYTEASDKTLTQVEGISWEFTGRKGGSRVPVSTKIENKMRPYMAGSTKTVLRA